VDLLSQTSLDSRVAEAKEILQARGLYSHGLFSLEQWNRKTGIME
jgi:hypothetical protein